MIRVELWGDYACFSRPEMKTERVSYDVMTPSAARGILDSIYWYPGLTWNISSIKVCTPINFMNIGRNEVKSKVGRLPIDVITSTEPIEGKFYLSIDRERQQRSSMILKNVRYVVEAYFTIDPTCVYKCNPARTQDIITSRIRKGKAFNQPYLGCREFSVNFAFPEKQHDCPESLKGEIDLGLMFYDFDYSDKKNIRPLFFRAIMVDGVLRIPARNSREVIG